MDYARTEVKAEMARKQSKGRRQKQQNPAPEALWLPLTRRDSMGLWQKQQNPAPEALWLPLTRRDSMGLWQKQQNPASEARRLPLTKRNSMGRRQKQQNPASEARRLPLTKRKFQWVCGRSRKILLLEALRLFLVLGRGHFQRDRRWKQTRIRPHGRIFV